jgi:hypothetical protein
VAWAGLKFLPSSKSMVAQRFPKLIHRCSTKLRRQNIGLDTRGRTRDPIYGTNLPPGTALSPLVRIGSTFTASGFKASGLFVSTSASPR